MSAAGFQHSTRAPEIGALDLDTLTGLRAALAAAVERAINLIDEIDGDENLEEDPDREGHLAYIGGRFVVIDEDRDEDILDQPHDEEHDGVFGHHIAGGQGA